MLKSDPAILRLGIPNGSLQASTIDLFAKAGYKITVRDRSYFPSIDDKAIEVVLFRPQEMSRFVEDGVVDLGLTGSDWITENNSNVHEVAELVYSKATGQPARRWVLCVPSESNMQKPEDLAGGVIATELVGFTKRYFEQKNVNVKVEFSWGATEVKARLLDAIVDITETGSSIRANNLRIIDTLLTSTPRLIANKKTWADPAKKEQIENIALLLKGAMSAREKTGLKLNAPKNSLDAILAILPAEKSPTVSPLADGAWCAVEVIVEEKSERDLIPKLKRAGATGIISYPLNKVIP